MNTADVFRESKRIELRSWVTFAWFVVTAVALVVGGGWGILTFIDRSGMSDVWKATVAVAWWVATIAMVQICRLFTQRRLQRNCDEMMSLLRRVE